MRSRTLGPVAIAAVALALSAAAVLLPADRADAQIVTEIVVTVSPSTEQQNVAVTDLDSDNVTFALSVSVSRPVPLPFTPITVTPTAFIADLAGWGAVISPENARFNGSGSAEFVADIIIPANLSAGRLISVDFSATVEGAVLFNLVPDEGLVTVLPYYKIGRTYSTEARTFNQGDRGSLNFTITNRGNGEDTIEIVLGDEAGLELRGITIQYPRTQRLESWESTAVQFFLNIEKDAPSGTAQINFTLKSQGSGDKVTSSVQFTIQVEETALRALWMNYWWAIVLLVVVLVVAVYIVRRRRRHRREDAEALEYLKRKEARRQAGPAGEKAVAGSGAREAPASEEAPEAGAEDDGGGVPGVGAEAEEAVEVEVGVEVEGE